MCSLFTEAIRPLVDDTSCDVIASLHRDLPPDLGECHTCDPFTPAAPTDTGCEPCIRRAKVGEPLCFRRRAELVEGSSSAHANENGLLCGTLAAHVRLLFVAPTPLIAA